MFRYVVHVLVVHTCTCAQIETVQIVGINCMLTLNVACQTIEKGSLRLKLIYRRLEREEVGDQYTRVASFCNKTVQQRRLFEAQSDIETKLEPRKSRGSVH